MTWLPWRRDRGPGREHAIARFRRDTGRILDDFARGFFPSPTTWGESPFGPALDMHEDEEKVTVEIEVPGLAPEDVEVSVSESSLTVRGEKRSERREEDGDYHFTERSYGSFSRTVALPAQVDAGKAEATQKQGVVTISLPKTEKAKARARAKKIPVR